ncbi:MAG TPA: hypothetical protein VEB40_08325, partial [Flavipsychrobacter sp.]|nr:hypothetical protein [Flavipsychrobacter sp.]
YDRSRYEKAWGSAIKHRHTVHLERGNRMIIELGALSGYQRLRDINSILKRVQKNVAAYADSIPEEYNEHLIVKYVTSVMPDNDKVRFRRVNDGDVFMERNGELTRIKVPQDTIRILVYNSAEAGERKPNDLFSESYLPVYINLLLNNYSDIQQLIDDKQDVQHYIDTMALLAKPKKDRGRRDPGSSTIYYRPGSDRGKDYIQVYRTITDRYSPAFDMNHDRVSLSGNIGAGLVRSKLAPLAEIGLEYRDYWVSGQPNYSIFGVYAAPYFLFDRSDGKIYTHTNWFINAEIGSFFERDNEIMGLKMKRLTIGAGYLLNPDQIFFQTTTIKVFGNFQLGKGFTISPELISTNNFKNIFPGLTIKVF